MKRLFTLVVLLLIVGNALLARRVPLEQAQGYARNWWLQKDGPRSVVLQHVATEFDNIYLFVDTAGRGFVMLAADDRSLPVLGYSLRNDFIVTDMPPHVYGWLQDYNDQIQWLIDNNIEKTKEINEQWKDLNNTQSQLPKAWSTSVSQLIHTEWGQSKPYNNHCPMDNDERSLTGCVATAMAQIMNYYEHPVNGIGSHSYKPDVSDTALTVDFSTANYDWANMLDEYRHYYGGAPYNYNTDQGNAVAKLMYHIGVAVEMDYGADGSGSYTVAYSKTTPSASNAYKDYFKYKWTVTSVFYSDFTDSEWKYMMKNELDNRRPVQYGGSGNAGGHSFVCDGYDNDEKFHFNWGWTGSYDGYFAIGSLNPGSYTFNSDNKAVIGIEPDRSTSSTVTINGVPNNVNYGTVSQTGNGTYTRFVDTVKFTPTAYTGYRFKNWENGCIDAPFTITASGEGNPTTVTANFESIIGDTLYYCKDKKMASYRIGYNVTQFWGIRIPSSSLKSEMCLYDVMLYVLENGDHTIHIYEGEFETELHSQTFNMTTERAWTSLHLSNAVPIDASKDLCIVFESNSNGFPVAVSSPAEAPYGSYRRTSVSTFHNERNTNGYYPTYMIKAITAPIHKITMDASKVTITSATKELDLSQTNLALSNKNAAITYTIDPSSPDNIATISNNKLTATGTGTIKIKATATDATFGAAEQIIDLTVGRGTLVFDGAQNDQDWSNVKNWNPHYSILPNAEDFDVQIDVTCTVPANAEATCHDLSLGSSGVLTVASKAVLNVDGALNNDNADKLLIKADAAGSGSVLFESGTPKATVEMYMKGTADANGKNPDWQLRGSIVGNDFALKNPDEWANIHVYRWDEANNANGCWTNKMVGSAINLEPWKGYGFANYSVNPATVKYSGTLLNVNHDWLLTKNGDNANTGNNMLTNSYSAPITISNLNFNGPKASVIFYNTGSLHDWQKYEGDTEKSGNQKGQMLVCPLWTAGAADLPTTIPAGQSFYVVANHMNDAVEVEYSDIANAHSEPMLAPGQQDEFNVLAVNVLGSNGDDRVVLIESDNCTDDYDDGYDGMKYAGNAALPQLFVSNSFGNTAINSSKTILGQKIGVYAPEVGTSLKMTFETAKLQGFARLLVQDLVTGRYVDVLAGEEYEFTTTANDTKRFEIVGFRMQNGEENDEQLRVYGNRLFVGENSGRMTMYDMSGKLVWQADVQPDEWLELPELLHGVYVIKTDGSTTKIIK